MAVGISWARSAVRSERLMSCKASSLSQGVRRIKLVSDVRVQGRGGGGGRDGERGGSLGML